MTSPDGSEILVFDGGGRHLRTVDALTKSVRLTFSYDAAGYVVAVEDDAGQKLTVERGADGKATGIVAPFGQRTSLTTDGNGRLSKIVDPIERANTFTYDAGGLLVARKDPRGGDHAATYDPMGGLLSDTGNAGKSWTLADASTNGAAETTLTSALGRVSRTTITRTGPSSEIRTITHPDGTKSTTAQTATSVSSQSPGGTKVDSMLAPDPQWGMSAPYAATSTETYPSGAAVKRVETREADRTDPIDPAAILSLSGSLAVGGGKPWRSEYVTATRTLTISSPEGRALRKVFDDHGRIVRVEAPTLHPVEVAYDASGRVSKVSQGAREDVFTYGATGFLESSQDSQARKVAYARDAAGRPLSVSMPGGRVVGLTFDGNDNPESVTPPGRPAYTFSHTLDDLVATAKAPDEPQLAVAYDADRAVSTITREDGQKISVVYGDDGRWKETQLPTGTVSADYDAAGRLAKLSGPGTSSLSISYDGGRPVAVAATGPAQGVVAYTYDTHGRISREKVGLFGGHDLAVDYDEDDLPLSFGPVKMGRDSTTGWLSTLQVAGTYETIERVVAGEVTSYGEPVHWRVSLNGAGIYDLTLERDILGRVTRRAELLDGTTRAYVYTYDDAGRLAGVQEDGATVGTYTYDANGNRLSQSGTTTLGAYDSRDRLTSHGDATYEHDARGNRSKKTLAGTVTTYEHDAGATGGPLRRVATSGTVVEYVTDALGRRVSRSKDGTVTHRFLYSGGTAPIAELDAAGAIRYRFVYATGRHTPDAAIDASGVSYALITDQIGSLRLVVRASDGAIVQRMRHDAWGRVSEDFVADGFSPLPFGFAGGVVDRTTGLVHLGAREYDAEVGRWLERDPLGFGGGDTGLYSYVRNDPVGETDSSGLISDSDVTYGVKGASPKEINDGIARNPLVQAEAAVFAGAAAVFLAPAAAEAVAATRLWMLARAGIVTGPLIERGFRAAKAAGGDCLDAQKVFLRVTGVGRPIELIARGDRPMQVLPGLFNSPVGLHAAVLLKDGRVVDPYLQRTFQNVAAFIEAIVGPNAGTIRVIVDRAVIKWP